MKSGTLEQPFPGLKSSGVSSGLFDVSADAGKILFTLSSKEWNHFLPGFSASDVSDAGADWFPSCEHQQEEWVECLEKSRPEVLVTNWSSRPVPLEILESSDCRLKYVCHMTGSVRHLVPRFFFEKGGIASNWDGLAGQQVAEHALLLALAALRRLPSWRPYMLRSRSSSDWPIVDVGACSLFGRNVGLHGFGHVARALVRLLEPFGSRVRAYSEGVPEALFAEHDVERCQSLEQLFSLSDIVFECEALNLQTSGIVGEPELARLPDGAVFVNIGRCAVVVEEALVREAVSGRIHVALDVFTDEFACSVSPFFGLPNALLSPHIAGPTIDRLPALGAFALNNIERYFGGLSPEGLVTLDIYDRST